MKLLDTTFLIHYWAGEERTREYLERHADDNEFVTTAINLKEIAAGKELQSQFNQNEIRSTFNWVEVIPFDSEHAFIAGQLEADLRRDDTVDQDKINALVGDLLIVAVAKQRGAPVVTQNEDDFAMFDGVTVETY
ncbi:VapC toxin family PIN domain ribonuclease [Halobacteriales archaeon QS_9_68_17]|nr:MAG: VapC toxin family PIN domain ribonuclease [Halobacteriales archaeon QS_9_68_17]